MGERKYCVESKLQGAALYLIRVFILLFRMCCGVKNGFYSYVRVAGGFLSVTSQAKSAGISENQIKQRIIEESIAAYPGNCPCPFNAMRNGRACGGRSAWSRKGGYSPICYSREVTAEMVKQWRAANAT